MKRLLTFALLLIGLSAGASQYFIDYSGGSDSAAGTSTGAAWKNCPGMPSAGSVAAAHNPVAGDQFIFKGGSTWPSTCFTFNMGGNGTAGNPIYYGTNGSWGSGFAVFDGNNSVSSFVWWPGSQYVTCKGFEVIRGFMPSSAGDGGFFNGASEGYITCDTLYMHNWTGNASIGESHSSEMVCILGGSTRNGPVNVQNCVLDNWDNPVTNWRVLGVAGAYGLGEGMKWVDNIISNNIGHQYCALLTGGSIVASNYIHDIIWPANRNAINHPNTLYLSGGWFNGSVIDVHDNLCISNMSVTGAFYIDSQSTYPYTYYIYNNVVGPCIPNPFGDINSLVEMDPEKSSLGPVSMWNNTFYVTAGQNLVDTAVRPGNVCASLLIRNNHLITGSGGGLVGTAGISSVTQDHNITETEAQATSYGATRSTIWQPTSASDPAVGAGTPVSYFNDDYYGTTRTVPWDVGAFKFGSASVDTNAPTISSQSAGGTNLASVGITVSVTANHATSHQWKLGGSAVSGATGASYTANATNQSGSYQCWITNANATGRNWTNTVAVQVLLTNLPPYAAGQWFPATGFTTISGNYSIASGWLFQPSQPAGSTEAAMIAAGAYVATYQFTVATNGNYQLLANSSAADGSANSVWIGIGTNPPPDPTSIWDMPLSGSATNYVGWRGTNTDGSTLQYNPTTWALTAGLNTLYLVGREANAQVGFFNVIPQGIVTNPPSITTQPANQTVSQGSNAVFTVAATGTAPMAYQWRFSGANLPGANGTSYTVISCQPSNAGNFDVVVVNAGGNVTSSVATLAVTVSGIAPTITVQPASTNVSQGNVATFLCDISANTTLPARYQWSKGGTVVQSSTALKSYTIASVASSDAGSYTVVVTNLYGTASSTAAVLTVTVPATAPSISSQPASQTIASGNTATFSVTAAGTAPLKYQWFMNGTAQTLATNSSWSVIASNNNQGGQFSCVVSNSSGTASSLAATLTVIVPPVIVSGVGNQTVNQGATARLSVIESGWGNPAPSYRWSFNGTPLSDGGRVSGSATASLAISGLVSNDAGSYSVTANNSGGSASSSGNLTVALAPWWSTQPISQVALTNTQVQFLAIAGGYGSRYFWWQHAGTNYTTTPNIFGFILTFFAAPGLDGNWQCIASNSVGMATSTVATLTLTNSIPPGPTVNPPAAPTLLRFIMQN